MGKVFYLIMSLFRGMGIVARFLQNNYVLSII